MLVTYTAGPADFTEDACSAIVKLAEASPARGAPGPAAESAPGGGG